MKKQTPVAVPEPQEAAPVEIERGNVIPLSELEIETIYLDDVEKVRDIAPSPYQPREALENDDLVESIIRHGRVIENIQVFEIKSGRLECARGHRRQDAWIKAKQIKDDIAPLGIDVIKGANVATRRDFVNDHGEKLSLTAIGLYNSIKIAMDGGMRNRDQLIIRFAYDFAALYPNKRNEMGLNVRQIMGLQSLPQGDRHKAVCKLLTSTAKDFISLVNINAHAPQVVSQWKRQQTGELRDGERPINTGTLNKMASLASSEGRAEGSALTDTEKKNAILATLSEYNANKSAGNRVAKRTLTEWANAATSWDEPVARALFSTFLENPQANPVDVIDGFRAIAKAQPGLLESAFAPVLRFVEEHQQREIAKRQGDKTEAATR